MDCKKHKTLTWKKQSSPCVQGGTCQVNPVPWEHHRCQQCQLSAHPSSPVTHLHRAPSSFVPQAVLQKSDPFHISLWKHNPLFSLHVRSCINYTDQPSPPFSIDCSPFTISVSWKISPFHFSTHLPFSALLLSLLWVLTWSILHHLTQRDAGYSAYFDGAPGRGASPQKWLSSPATGMHSVHFMNGMERAFTWFTAKLQGHSGFFCCCHSDLSRKIVLLQRDAQLTWCYQWFLLLTSHRWALTSSIETYLLLAMHFIALIWALLIIWKLQ